jgi:hypothetical protein
MSRYRNLTEKYYMIGTGATSISAPIYEGFSLSFLIVSRKASAATFTVTFQQAAASTADPCLPDAATWVNIPTVVECDDPAGTTSVAAAVAAVALPANSVMQAEVPCVVGPFVRAVITGTDAATTDSYARIGHLRRWQNP